MPPTRTRAVSARLAGPPVRRGGQGRRSTNAVAEGPPEAAPSSAAPPDQRLAEGIEAVMAELQAMQRTGTQLLARMETVEKTLAEISAAVGSSAAGTQPELTPRQQTQAGEARVTHVSEDLHVTVRLNRATSTDLMQGDTVIDIEREIQQPRQQASASPPATATTTTPSLGIQHGAHSQRTTGGINPVRNFETGQTATAKPRRADLAAVLKVGDRVRRGPDWSAWRDNSDGGGPGTVTAIPSRREGPGWVDVRWDNGKEGFYYMGFNGCYDLDLA